MKESYVSYEQAVKLKEMWFNEPCFAFYDLDPDGEPLLVTSILGYVFNSDLNRRDPTAPFLWQAQKWLREVKGIAINVIAHDGGFYQWENIYLPIAADFDNYVYPDLTQYDSYEQALSVGIDKCLALLLLEDEQ